MQKEITKQNILIAANKFYENQEREKIEKLFAQYLKSSYDYELWQLYLKYVKNLSQKKVKLTDVYTFILGHFDNGYANYEFIISCIEELDKTDDNIKQEKIRKIYHQFLRLPGEKLSQLWNQYENWEISVNRLNAKSLIEQIQPFYLNALSVYNRLTATNGSLQSDISLNMFNSVLDIELENPLKLTKKQWDQRISFVFKYFQERVKEEDKVEVLKTLYVSNVYDAEKDIEKLRKLASESLLLSFWLSFHYKKDLFYLEKSRNFNLSCVNLLNWTMQNEGMVSFRTKFKELLEHYQEKICEHVYIYVAYTELIHSDNSKAKGDKRTVASNLAFEILCGASEKFPESSLLNEEFLNLMLGFNDIEKVQIVFKKIRKTEKMYDKMINFSLRSGSFADFNKLLLEKQEAIKNNELLAPNTVSSDIMSSNLLDTPYKGRTIKRSSSAGILSSISSSFEFLDLKFVDLTVAQELIKKLPQIPESENIFKDVDTTKLIGLLLAINQ
ncbi:hypothetical protein NUSPORA_01918 [Nucleospora cyclopteri]